MTVKRILIIAPVVLILFLLQSYFWVPTYEQQTRGNPERLREYITASIGDASLLNPILSADSSSSQIGSLVFEGLIDRDEELRFRGRLATTWEVYEEAYFYVNSYASIPSLGKADAEAVTDLIRSAKGKGNVSGPGLKASLDNITAISIIPPKEYTVTPFVKDGGKKKRQISIRIKAPARIKLVIKKVDQALFKNLEILLGQDYFSSFPGEQLLHTTPKVGKEQLAVFAKELLPATEHNPILVFHLRPNVRFQSSHRMVYRLAGNQPEDYQLSHNLNLLPGVPPN